MIVILDLDADREPDDVTMPAGLVLAYAILGLWYRLREQERAADPAR
jgi:hypothetical protein